MNRIQLPGHYIRRTVASMYPDEVLFPQHGAVNADYITKNLYIDTHWPIDADEHDRENSDSPLPSYVVDGRIALMKVLKRDRDNSVVDGYVADLRNGTFGKIPLEEIEEATDDDAVKAHYRNKDADAIDYNAYLSFHSHYKPLLAAAVLSLEGEVEYIGEGVALDAAKSLRELVDTRKKETKEYFDRVYGNDSDYDPDEDVKEIESLLSDKE